MMSNEVLTRANPRLRRMVFAWFDFSLNHHEKAALLQNFPRVSECLHQFHPDLSLVAHQPKGKEAICEQLALMFTETLNETEQLRVRHDPDLPKHYKQPEMDDFLKAVRVSCARAQHKPAFQ